MSSLLPALSSVKLRRAVFAAGVGLAGAALLYYLYRRRRSNLVEEIGADYVEPTDRRTTLKQQLKELLNKENVHCADIDYVEEVIDNLISSGKEQLQVIADFDRTMTPLTYGGKGVPSTHGVLESCPHLPSWFKSEVDKTRVYYQSIEFNPAMTREDKIPYMVEWWAKAEQRLLSCKLKKDYLEEAVQLSNLHLREKGEAILHLMFTNDLPLLLFSAGIGDIIELMLVQRYRLYDNIHIISNRMEFDEQGVLVGFKGETIHTFNKNTHALQNASYFDSLRHRHNVILLGDSLGDLDIADGLIKVENLLTIGYLNEHVEESLAEYTDRFDIVLANEPSLNLLHSLLENIIHCS